MAVAVVGSHHKSPPWSTSFDTKVSSDWFLAAQLAHSSSEKDEMRLNASSHIPAATHAAPQECRRDSESDSRVRSFRLAGTACCLHLPLVGDCYTCQSSDTHIQLLLFFPLDWANILNVVLSKLHIPSHDNHPMLWDGGSSSVGKEEAVAGCNHLVHGPSLAILLLSTPVVSLFTLFTPSQLRSAHPTGTAAALRAALRVALKTFRLILYQVFGVVFCQPQLCLDMVVGDFAARRTPAGP